MPSKRRGTLRLLLGTGTVLGALVVVLIVLFIVGVPLQGNLARGPLESLLTKVFGVPTRIEGPLRLRTGLVASAEAGALVLTDPSSPGAPPLARATQPRVRIDLAALLQRAVKLDEITGAHMEVRIARGADGRSNWDPVITPSGGAAPVRFAGIGQLRIASIGAVFLDQGAAEPVKFEVGGFEGALSEREPAKARGTLSLAGRTFVFDASTASLAELLRGALKTIPLHAAIESSGARVKVKGAYELAAAALGAHFEVTAKDADTALAAIGVAARGSGALNASGQMRVSSQKAGIDGLALRLGKTSVSGSVDVDWEGARPRVVLDLAAEAFDENPFVAGAGRARGKTAIEGLVELIHGIATAIDLDAKASVGKFFGLVAALRDATMEASIDDRMLAIRGSGDLLGMKTKVTLDYSARDPKRTLKWRLEGGRFSSEKLPGAARPGQLAGTVGGLRGEAHASGFSARELVASARLDFSARDLRFSWPHDARPPTEVRLNSARLDIASGRSVAAEVRGQLGRHACRVKVTGGTLVSLLAEERWPLKLDASCRGAKLVSKGHIVLKGPSTTGALQFDASANPIGPFVEPLGLAADATLALAARGQFSLTEDLARLKLDQIRLGRTAGAATALLGLGRKRRDSVKLVLETLDAAELAALASKARKEAPTEPLAREVLPAKVRLPELDLALSAKVARVFGETLRGVRFDAASRDGALPSTEFEFDWQGAAVTGEVAADFRGARPAVELSITSKNADIGAALGRAGYKAPALRAGTIRASARGGGVKLGELLRSATAEVTVEQGRLENVKRFIPGVAGDAAFSAKLAVTEGQPGKLSASGRAGDVPFKVAIETAPLTQLAQAKDRLSGTLRASLGEAQLEVSGDVTLEGAVDARFNLSGERLDRLGRLAAVRLPEVGPYAFGASVVIAPDAIRASDLNLKFGSSSVLGKVSVRRGGERLAHTAELRAPVLHLEDLGLHLLPGVGGEEKPGKGVARSEELTEQQRIDRLRGQLGAFDATTTLDIAALHAEGEHYAKVRIEAALSDGDLRVALEDTHLKGGEARADLRLDTSPARPRIRMRVQTKGFEFGRIAEALKPKTPLEGTLDLSLDLAMDVLQRPLLGGANGHVDIAIYPRGLEVGAADYWGTGLLHVLQLGVDPAATSKLNCAVGVFDIKDGVSTSKAFFADTTRVRIIGELESNLVTRKLSGRLSPNAKNPGLINVAPSLGIAGTMESPEVIVTAESLITTPLRLFFPIHAFALDWLNQTGVPPDGSAGCREAFEKARTAGSGKPATPAAPDKGVFPF